jgi:hypothetical protein
MGRRVLSQKLERATLEFTEPVISATLASLPSDEDPVPHTDAAVTGSIKQLTGVWGPDVRACQKSISKRTGYLPMVITSSKAQAGEAFCRFQNVQQSGREWLVTAQCGAGPKRWKSRVSLVLSGSRLSWKSARGTQDTSDAVRSVWQRDERCQRKEFGPAILHLEALTSTTRLQNIRTGGSRLPANACPSGRRIR